MEPTINVPTNRMRKLIPIAITEAEVSALDPMELEALEIIDCTLGIPVNQIANFDANMVAMKNAAIQVTNEIISLTNPLIRPAKIDAKKITRIVISTQFKFDISSLSPKE